MPSTTGNAYGNLEHFSPVSLPSETDWETPLQCGRGSTCRETCQRLSTKATGRKSQEKRRGFPIESKEPAGGPLPEPTLALALTGQWEHQMENQDSGDLCSGFIPTCGLFIASNQSFPLSVPLVSHSYHTRDLQGLFSL